MKMDEFLPKQAYSTLKSGSVRCKAPSNIALVKYWGKYGEQLPKNTSLSFTLSQCVTETELYYKPKENATSFNFEVFLDDEKKAGFEPKIQAFFNRIEKFIPFLKSYKFTIKTSNSFPHSSGIASSASGMSALALCLLVMEKKMGANLSEEEFQKKASFIARLGSGSASRSIQGPLVSWGKHNQIKGSSNLFGTAYKGEVSPVFKNYQDTILLVETGAKTVSSTLGHNLMNDHPYATRRFEQANEHILQLQNVLASGDLDAFVNLVELEALTLHAMMMTSNPYFLLMKEHTLSIINAVWDFRKNTHIPVCFTLDAGANVHLLYPEANKMAVQEFIAISLARYCKEGRYIHDTVGTGAEVFS